MKALAILIGFLIGLSAYGQEESWNTVKKGLPLKDVFEAGTRVVFEIDYDNYSLVDYSNMSDGSAKIIFHVSKDGEALPDEKIGPVKFRTINLDPGEKIQMTYNWEKGRDVTLEIYEGQVQVEVRPEKKPI